MNSNFLTLQNRWWENPANIDTDQHLAAIKGKPYQWTPPLLHEVAFEAGDVFILRGPRQVGKTTTIKMMIRKLLKDTVPPKRILYLSCESLTSFGELQSVLADYLTSYQREHTFLFLDEVSFVDEWQRAVLAIANVGLTQKATLIVTGSNAKDLKKSGERLPGRRGKGKDIELFPLTIRDMQTLECFSQKTFEELLTLYMKVGGFPRAIADYVGTGCVTDATYDIYRNWIIGDASRYALQQETLKHILHRIAITMTSRITWPKLIENSPVKSHETALQYVEHLQDAFLCHVHYCYDPDHDGPSFHKSRKIYFIDPLLNAIAFCWKEGTQNIFQWWQSQLVDDSFRGKVFEQTVINHLRRQHEQLMYWYSSKNEKEIDVVVKEKGRYRFYDIKLSATAPFNAFNQTVDILDPATLCQWLTRQG